MYMGASETFDDAIGAARGSRLFSLPSLLMPNTNPNSIFGILRGYLVSHASSNRHT
jgi:hypothetical protein